jgi:apurinic endonuclease APN1
MSSIQILNINAGSHVPFSKAIKYSIAFGIKNSMTCIQFFLGSPKSYERHIASDEDIEDCNKLLLLCPMCIYTHFPYMSNLAGSVVDGLAWSGNDNVDANVWKRIRGVEHELKISSRLNSIASGVVIHPGSYKNTLKGLEKVAETINKINFPPKSTLLLENCAAEGTKLCKNFTEIKTVLDLIDEDKKANVGVCVDTAHIWGAGDYDLRKVEDVTKMFDDFSEIIGIEHFKLLHLNDSKALLGSHKDIHQLIGEGEIWSEDLEPLKLIIKKCAEYDIPIILETSPSDMVKFAYLQ